MSFFNWDPSSFRDPASNRVLQRDHSLTEVSNGTFLKEICNGTVLLNDYADMPKILVELCSFFYIHLVGVNTKITGLQYTWLDPRLHPLSSSPVALGSPSEIVINILKWSLHCFRLLCTHSIPCFSLIAERRVVHYFTHRV